jgi:hypothetical protein
MLAQQATNRLRFELQSLEDKLATVRDPELSRYEAEMAMGQTEALQERIRPFTSYIDQATRFEAQEIVAALEVIRRELGTILDKMVPSRPNEAADVAARLMTRRA